MRTTPQEIRMALEDYMPHYFRLLNPIIHKWETDSVRLNENQIKALLCIHYLGNISPTVISNAVNIQKGSLTTIVRSLADLGMVEKVFRPDNDRSYQVQITQKGHAFLQERASRIEAELQSLFSGLDDASLKAVTDAFRLLSGYLGGIPYNDPLQQSGSTHIGGTDHEHG